MEVLLVNAGFFTMFGLAIANGCPTWGWLALLGAWAVGNIAGMVVSR